MGKYDPARPAWAEAVGTEAWMARFGSAGSVRFQKVTIDRITATRTIVKTATGNEYIFNRVETVGAYMQQPVEEREYNMRLMGNSQDSVWDRRDITLYALDSKYVAERMRDSLIDAAWQKAVQAGAALGSRHAEGTKQERAWAAIAALQAYLEEEAK